MQRILYYVSSLLVLYALNAKLLKKYHSKTISREGKHISNVSWTSMFTIMHIENIEVEDCYFQQCNGCYNSALPNHHVADNRWHIGLLRADRAHPERRDQTVLRLHWSPHSSSLLGSWLPT